MLSNLLGTVICQTFQKEVGKWQVKKEDRHGMLIGFSANIDYDQEEGYRHIELFLYAPMNYVQVWTRERWNVAPLDDEDAPYTEGATDWRLIMDHDSGWREAIRSFLFEHRNDLLTFSGLRWYEATHLPKSILAWKNNDK